MRRLFALIATLSFMGCVADCVPQNCNVGIDTQPAPITIVSPTGVTVVIEEALIQVELDARPELPDSIDEPAGEPVDQQFNSPEFMEEGLIMEFEIELPEAPPVELVMDAEEFERWRSVAAAVPRLQYRLKSNGMCLACRQQIEDIKAALCPKGWLLGPDEDADFQVLHVPYDEWESSGLTLPDWTLFRGKELLWKHTGYVKPVELAERYRKAAEVRPVSAVEAVGGFTAELPIERDALSLALAWLKLQYEADLGGISVSLLDRKYAAAKKGLSFDFAFGSVKLPPTQSIKVQPAENSLRVVCDPPVTTRMKFLGMVPVDVQVTAANLSPDAVNLELRRFPDLTLVPR